MDPQPYLTMSSQPFDTIDTTRDVPVWVVLVTLGVLVVTWSVTTFAVDQRAIAAEPPVAMPAVSLTGT